VSVELIGRRGGVLVCQDGKGADFSEDQAHQVLQSDHVTIKVDLHAGSCEGVAFGCDLTYDYVKINAEYRS
jgi:glutamate N-acetyltransferase/amino-acid N-acetyltransferase